MAIQTHIQMEMGRYLRQLVDNSFEEGQFEGAVATLDQLRSPDHRPSIIHTLHLIFISLHSSTTSCRLDTEGIDATDDYNSLLKSPRKMVKAAKSALSLSPEAVSGAQRLLFSFLATNGPHALYAALPQYPESEAAKRQMNFADGGGVQFMAEFVDSPIYAQAIAVKNARSVWEVVKEGFADRASTQAMGGSKGKARARPGLQTRGLAREGTMGDLGDDEELKSVGHDSWTFLEWLVTLFEKDAEEVEAQGSAKYSSLLLRQLPPPPGGTNTRFDASESLKVACYALEQEDERHQPIGLRLLQLLLDLTFCQYLNLSSLTGAVIAHLTSASEPGSPKNPPDSVQSSDNPPPSNPLTTLLDLLPSTLATLPFKVALCQKILQDASGSSSSSSRPAPRARAAPTSSRGGNAVNGNANDPSPGAPNLGINPATGRPIVSAMKKPGPKPRPRSNTLTTASGSFAEPSHAENTSEGVASSEASGVSPPMAMAPSASGGSSVMTTASGSTTGSGPAVKPRPQIPRFADVAQAANAQVQHAAEPRQTRHGGGAARQNGQSQARTPWSAPLIILRVRFELLLACAQIVVLLSQQQATDPSQAIAPPPPSAGSASGSAAAGDEVLSEWVEATKEEDGRFSALVEQVFGTPRPGESEGEKEDRVFYADVVRSHAGYAMTSFGT